MAEYPSRAAAFEAGRRVGAKEERERLAAEHQQGPDGDGPPKLTLEAIRSGRFSDDELIARKDELDALLSGGDA